MRDTKVIYGFCGLILIVLVLQAVFPKQAPAITDVEPEDECKGEPIVVDYAYNGGVNEPHACAIQCQDGKQRYILYTNGVATPCQDLPGCFDMGEDQGITCRVPNKTAVSS